MRRQPRHFAGCWHDGFVYFGIFYGFGCRKLVRYQSELRIRDYNETSDIKENRYDYDSNFKCSGG